MACAQSIVCVACSSVGRIPVITIEVPWLHVTEPPTKTVPVPR